MPNLYAQTTSIDPSRFGWVGQQAWGGFGSPADQFIAGTLTGKIDPVTGLPIGGTGPGSSIPGVPPKPVTPATGYTPSPQATTGSNPFGYIPGQLGLPNPAGDLQAQIPGLQGLNAQASNTLSNWLSGTLGSDELANIQNKAATYGVRSGMPLSGLASNDQLLGNILTAYDKQKAGLAALNPFVASVSQTQTLSPALQAQIAETNAINAAAPDPTMAASYAKELYDKYLATLSRSGAGNRSSATPRTPNYGPAGGTGAYSGIPQGGFLPHLSDNLDYKPGAFDYASQFNGGYGNTPSTGVLQSDINPVGNFGQIPFDNTFGVPQDQTYVPQGTGDYYPNYVQDWFGGDPGAGTGYLDWFGG